MCGVFVEQRSPWRSIYKKPVSSHVTDGIWAYDEYYQGQRLANCEPKRLQGSRQRRVNILGMVGGKQNG